MEISVDTKRIAHAPTAGLLALALAVLGGLWLSGVPLFLQEVRTLTGANGSSAAYRLATCGNTLLAVSAVMYVANLLLSLEQVGRWASRFAAAGAFVLALNAGSHMLGLERLSVADRLSFLDLYDGLSAVVPILVACYLLAEHAGRNRNAGAVVMPLIVGLIGVEMWLLAQDAGSRDALAHGFRQYWGHAYLVAHLVGYGAFVIAAGVGLLFLLRRHLESGGRRLPSALRRLPDGWKAQNWMLSGVAAGVPVFVLALFLVAGWSFGAGAPGAYVQAKAAWIVSLLAFYGAFLYALYSRSMSGQRMAWWTVAGLGLSLALFLGAHLLALAPGSYAA